jgi:hypothetical protein
MTTATDIAAPYEALRPLRGLLRHEEGAWLAERASEVDDGHCVVEIGSFTGKSACYLAEGSKRGHGVPVHCVDPWTDGTQKFKTAKFSRSINRRTFDEKTAPWADLIHPHQGLSIPAGIAWDGPPIGLLWIDGDHTLEGALADFGIWSQYVPVGGIVALHDYDADYEAKTPHAAVIAACDDHIAHLPAWEPIGVVERIWAARRIK